MPRTIAVREPIITEHGRFFGGMRELTKGSEDQSPVSAKPMSIIPMLLATPAISSLKVMLAVHGGSAV